MFVASIVMETHIILVVIAVPSPCIVQRTVNKIIGRNTYAIA